MAIEQFLGLYVFGPLGLKDYGSATLRCKILSLPFLALCPHALHPGAIQGKEGIKFCHLATLAAAAAAHDNEGDFRAEQIRFGYDAAKFDAVYLCRWRMANRWRGAIRIRN